MQIRAGAWEAAYRECGCFVPAVLVKGLGGGVGGEASELKCRSSLKDSQVHITPLPTHS